MLRNEVREIEPATRLGQDLIDHGVRSSVVAGEQDAVEEGALCRPSKRMKTNTQFKNMLQLVTNLKLVLKIVEVREVNNMNFLKNSINGRGQYSVHICNTPSCTCLKFGSLSTWTVYCNHIMFVLIFALGVKDNSILGGIYISDEDLKTVLQKIEIAELYLEEKTFPQQKKP